jgi:hypothetical protein
MSAARLLKLSAIKTLWVVLFGLNHRKTRRHMLSMLDTQSRRGLLLKGLLLRNE